MTSSPLWSLYIAIVVIVVVAIIWFYVASRASQNKVRCPRCGSSSVQTIPKKWTAFRPYAVHYKYRCLKCQNEWEADETWLMYPR